MNKDVKFMMFEDLQEAIHEPWQPDRGQKAIQIYKDGELLKECDSLFEASCFAQRSLVMINQYLRGEMRNPDGYTFKYKDEKLQKDLERKKENLDSWHFMMKFDRFKEKEESLKRQIKTLKERIESEKNKNKNIYNEIESKNIIIKTLKQEIEDLNNYIFEKSEKPKQTKDSLINEIKKYKNVMKNLKTQIKTIKHAEKPIKIITKSTFFPKSDESILERERINTAFKEKMKQEHIKKENLYIELVKFANINPNITIPRSGETRDDILKSFLFRYDLNILQKGLELLKNPKFYRNSFTNFEFFEDIKDGVYEDWF